ncbi:DUF2515 family protein [Xenorhabdus bovienii]|uniref:DUF2515 family protein n=1 Tax=Xenorhabdus bovienii TaxID=40576 RepID=UPI0020CA45C5|nr:hypothetical protein [Xenorhabdus bovienii]
MSNNNSVICPDCDELAKRVAHIRLVADYTGKPIPNKPFTLLKGEAIIIQGTSDGNGVSSEEVLTTAPHFVEISPRFPVRKEEVKFFKQHRYDSLTLNRSTKSLAECKSYIDKKYGKVVDVPILTAECLWHRYQKEAEYIVAPGGQLIADPIARNKRINQTYANVWLKDNRFQWAGLAAFASKQVGCGLLHAIVMIKKMQAEDDAIIRRRESLKEREFEWNFPKVIIRESESSAKAKEELEQASKNNPLTPVFSGTSSVMSGSTTAATILSPVLPVPGIGPTATIATIATTVSSATETVSDLSSLPSSPLPSIPSPDELKRMGMSKAAQQSFNYVYTMMALGNTALFLDVYPLHAFYKQRGLEELKACLPERKTIYGNREFPVLWPIAQEKLEFGRNYAEILQTFEAIDAGNIAESVKFLAYHEQVNILQTSMYSDPILVGLLRSNHIAFVTNLLPAGITESIELTLAGQCKLPDGDERTIQFSDDPQANLAEVKQRMPFVLRAAQRFDELLHNNKRNVIEKSIQAIASGGGVK